MSPPIARKAIEYFAKSGPSSSLAAHEKEIIAGVVEGLSYNTIAARLNISPEIVRQQIKNIYTKLQG